MPGPLQRFFQWLRKKSAPFALTGGQWSGTQYTDRFKKYRNPTPNELLAELKSTAWTCASLNAATCASYAPDLYVVTRHNEPAPKCQRRPVAPHVEHKLRANPRLAPWLKSARRIEHVTNHTLLDLFAQPTPGTSLTSFDLWELTSLYLEVHGAAYWYAQPGPIGVPLALWVLPTQNIRPKRDPDSPRIVDYYEYRTGRKEQRFDPEDIIAFRYPDPRDPYTGGLSPLRAAFEQVSILADYAALRQSKLDNSAIPDCIVSPAEVIGEEERDRLEAQWTQKFRRGGAGRVVVAESGMKVHLLSHSLGDIAALADCKATKEDVANAFHVPLAFLSTQTNLANLQASRSQHMEQAISPRLARRDETLNLTLLPRFDPSRRLFLSSEDPVPADQDAALQQLDLDMKYGILSVNEVRGGRGLPPMPWGNVPWMPLRWGPTDVPRIQPGEAHLDEPPSDSIDYGAEATDGDE